MFARTIGIMSSVITKYCMNYNNINVKRISSYHVHTKADRVAQEVEGTEGVAIWEIDLIN